MPTITEALEYYYDHPKEFVEDVIGVKPTQQQAIVLDNICKHKHLSIKSGHGIGKTAMLSWIIIWFMTTRPHAKIPCTAPTQHQLFDILWSELKKWISKIQDVRVREMFEWTQTHLTNKYNPETWFAVARASSKAENMQGFHANELLFLVDEASGVPQDIMEVIQGALTNEGAYCIMTGNPTKLSGAFYDSFHSDRAYWKTFTFNSEESPMVSSEYIERMAGKYGGKNTNIYKIRVLGEFPSQEENTVIPLEYAMAAASNEIDITVLPTEDDPIYVGVDVARFGNDKTVIITRFKNKVLSMKSYSKASTMETTGNIMLAIKKYEGSPVVINVDDTGLGGGVTDRLNELITGTTVIVQPINNGSKALSNDKYANLGAELWFNMREHIREWDIPDDQELIAELATRHFMVQSKNGRFQLEPKDKMRERGLHSPDKADALSLAFKESMQRKRVILWD